MIKNEHALCGKDKKISIIDDVALIELLGRDFFGKVGIDFRIFKAMADNNISVSFVVQGILEKGIGLVVATEKAEKAADALRKEFQAEFYADEVYDVAVDKEIAVVSVSGQTWDTFQKSLNALIKNNITPILINNTRTGDNVNFVLKKDEVIRASKVVRSEIFAFSKIINIAIFGVGQIGSTLIEQILDSAENIEQKKRVKLNIFAVANSKKAIFNENGVGENWSEELKNSGKDFKVKDVIDFARKNNLENLVAVDNTASKEFVGNYISLINSSFDLVSSNKIANTLDYGFYRELRWALKKQKKRYLYETNVGAGLPLIDTIGLLHLSGENITGIRGVFSGTLSYIFNNFSVNNLKFSEVLQQAISLGLTEPDPREDLCGNDVARKLLILARELELENETSEIAVQNLIPDELRKFSTKEFLENLNLLDAHYQKIKDEQEQGNVLRYVGELSGDLQQKKGVLEVKLISVPANSVLGQLKNSDSIFEIYTESYGSQPLVIQGAGAGAKVTSRGVFGDILRLS